MFSMLDFFKFLFFSFLFVSKTKMFIFFFNKVFSFFRFILLFLKLPAFSSFFFLRPVFYTYIFFSEILILS